MLEKFTDRARRVLHQANLEAQRYNHEYIGTEHILLGLAHDRSGIAGYVLAEFGMGYDFLKKFIDELVQKGLGIPMGKLPQTPRAKKVMEYAVEESKRLGHTYIGTEHILLGLLRESEGIAIQVFAKFKVKPEIVRNKIEEVLMTPGVPEKDPQKQIDVLSESVVSMGGALMFIAKILRNQLDDKNAKQVEDRVAMKNILDIIQKELLK